MPTVQALNNSLVGDRNLLARSLPGLTTANLVNTSCPRYRGLPRRKLQQQMDAFVDLLFAQSVGARISGALRSVGLVRRGNRI